MQTPHPDTQHDLRILIASTPKTGNTWLANLMADIYDLPIRELPSDFTLEQLEQLGPRWVMIQHVLPYRPLVRWLTDHHVHTLTTLRHPCDVLVSLFHFARGLALDPKMDEFAVRLLSGDWGQIGQNVVAFVRQYFGNHLQISAQWLWVSSSIGVRYENLWRDPVGTVKTVTQRICEVPFDRIERSVERCDLGLMRELAGQTAAFFRKGGSGHWRAELPETIINILRHEPPFPQLFRVLGYSLDGDDASATRPRAPRRLQNPFAGVKQFDNGAPILPFMKAAYWRLDPELTASFKMPISRTDDPDTFWAWLNAPAQDDPQRDNPDVLMISNIARWVYDYRTDLHAPMPDIFGAHRFLFVDWYIRRPFVELGLAPEFIKPVFERYVAWGNAIAQEYNTDPRLPPLTRLMVILHQQFDALQATFPNLSVRDRLPYFVWFLTNANLEYLVDESFVARARELFQTWAGQPAEESAPGARPTITRGMLYSYRHSAFAQQLFTDVLGPGRERFVSWFRRLGQWGMLFCRIYYIPLSDDDVKWADSPAGPGGADRDDPPITNLMAWIYDLRPDIRHRFPDPYGKDRMDFVLWILNHSAEYAGGQVIARPLLEWFCKRCSIQTI